MLWEASGTIYPIDEPKELCNLAYDLSMRTHMDGLRFACTIQTNQQASLVLPGEANDRKTQASCHAMGQSNS